MISLAVRFPKEEDKPKIVVVAQRLDIEYWEIFESGAKKAFHEFDIDGKVIAPDSLYPISNQPNMLKKVLNQQPDALIVAPTDPSVAIPVLEEYKKKNIPVLFTSRDIDWEYKTAYIGTDHYELGKTAGKLLGSMLQPGDQVAIIFGRIDDRGMIDRKNGVKKVLEDIGIEVVTEQSGFDHFGNPKPVMGTIMQFIAADLREVDLRFSDLIGADFRDADIRGADLTDSIFLTQAQVNAAKIDKHTKLPPSIVKPIHWLSSRT